MVDLVVVDLVLEEQAVLQQEHLEELLVAHLHQWDGEILETQILNQQDKVVEEEELVPLVQVLLEMAQQLLGEMV